MPVITNGCQLELIKAIKNRLFFTWCPLWNPHHIGILWLVAGAAPVSCLQVRYVSEVAWYGAHTGGNCYLVDLFTAFLVPGFGQKMHTIIIPSAIAKISTVFYLLTVGVRTQKSGL